MQILNVEHLTKYYPSFTLDDVCFSMEQGSIMGLIGRNGAGKSTTLKSMINFVHPDTGSVCFFGLPFLKYENDIKERIGFVAGGMNQYIKKPIGLISRVASRFYANWDAGAYRGFLERFQLDERKTPSMLSDGMKVKYSLTLALSHHAELLILDEPTSGLDPVSREEILDLFLSLSREGVGILFSTHITSDLEKCADGITYIRNGRVAVSEPLSRFIGRYRLLHFSEEQANPALLKGLIGCKRTKQGYSALLETRAPAGEAPEGRPATLDEIMIHLEQEAK